MRTYQTIRYHNSEHHVTYLRHHRNTSNRTFLTTEVFWPFMDRNELRSRTLTVPAVCPQA